MRYNNMSLIWIDDLHVVSVDVQSVTPMLIKYKPISDRSTSELTI